MRRYIVLAMFLCVFSSTARAEFEHYQDVGNWTISADFEDGWCIAHAIYEDSRTMIGLAWVPSESQFLVLLHDTDWDLPKGEVYDLEILFEGDKNRSPWSPTVWSSSSLVSTVTDAGVRKLAGRHWVAIYGERGNLVGQFSLEGSRRAMNATIRCTERIEPMTRKNPFGGRRASSNPFGGGARSSNPFD